MAILKDNDHEVIVKDYSSARAKDPFRELYFLLHLGGSNSQISHVIPLLGIFRDGIRGLCSVIPRFYPLTDQALKEVIRGETPEYKFLHLARQLIDGLVFIHMQGVAHCDIKPTNIVYDTSTRYAFYIDFGNSLFCRSLEHKITRPRGTIGWTPPEGGLDENGQQRSCNYNPILADLFVLGKLLAYCGETIGYWNEDFALLSHMLMHPDPACRPVLHVLYENLGDFWENNRLFDSLKVVKNSSSPIKLLRPCRSSLQDVPSLTNTTSTNTLSSVGSSLGMGNIGGTNILVENSITEKWRWSSKFREDRDESI